MPPAPELTLSQYQKPLRLLLAASHLVATGASASHQRCQLNLEAPHEADHNLLAFLSVFSPLRCQMLLP